MDTPARQLGKANRVPQRDASHLGAQLGQLLAAARDPSPVTRDPDHEAPATPYDWRDPHYFTDDQHHRLTQLLGQVAARMAEIFARFGRSAFEVSLGTLTQHFAGDLDRNGFRAPGPVTRDPGHESRTTEKGECPLFSLPFGGEKEPPCGYVSIAPQTACVWTTWLLGDAGTEDRGQKTEDSAALRDASSVLRPASSRVLSALEESLLSDLLAAVLNAFLGLWRSAHPLRPAGPVAKDPPQLPLEPTEEVCRIVFQVTRVAEDREQRTEDSAVLRPPSPVLRHPSSEVVFLLPCRRVAALVGRPITAPVKVPPQELSRAMMEHLQEVPVTITAVLASTTMTFQEVLNLAPGDILLLDKPVAEPAELILGSEYPPRNSALGGPLEGRPAFRGRPARQNGHQAVVIVE